MASLLSKAVEPLNTVLDEVKKIVNKSCQGLEPWQIIVYSGSTTLIAIALKNFLFQDESLNVRAKRTFFKLARKIPQIRQKIEEEKVKTRASIREELFKGHVGTFVIRLPEQGLSEEDVFKEIAKYSKMNHMDWKDGKVSGTVYNGDPALTKMAAKTYGLYAWANPLHPDVFQDVRRMEAEVVRMCCSMFNGDSETCGAMTSGGSESILLATLAYRNRAAAEKGIKYPEMLAPVTAHAAFDKASGYFKVKMVHAPVDPETQMVDVKAMKRLISRNTIMLVASSPHFPHGIIDPIEEVVALGEQYGIPVHVDACLGGFLIPFMEEAGYKLKPFDFRLAGVTSISADTHKYGFAPKGSSVILYRNSEYRKYQYFCQTDWPGGIYASPTIAGSRAGAIIATCWATMMHIGHQGYVDSTRKIVSTARYIEKGLREIDGIYVIGQPQLSVIGIASKRFNIYRLSEAVLAQGWNLNALQFPPAIHLCVTYVHTQSGVADRFLDIVRASVTDIMKDPDAKCGGAAAIYGMAQSIPDRSLVSEIAQIFIDACYNTVNPTDNETPAITANGVSNGPTKK